MVSEIVYVCNSINNKNIRGNELKILRKVEEELCFEFGESESNIKKRFYRNLETLNKDYAEVEKIKIKLENEKNVKEEVKEEEVEEVKDILKENKEKKYTKRNIF